MIHPIARLLIISILLYLVLMKIGTVAIMVVIATILLLHAASGTLPALALFLLTFVVPLSLGLVLIGSAGELTAESAIAAGLVSSRRIVLLGSVGSLTLWAVLPIFRSGSLMRAASSLALPSRAVVLSAVAFNSTIDLGRYVRTCLDAVRARGLANPPVVWRFTALFRLVPGIIVQALRVGLAREETWEHRRVTERELISASKAPWNYSYSVLSLGLVASVAWLLSEQDRYLPWLISSI